MAKVSGLDIKLQSNTDGKTYFARWSFNETTTKVSNTGVFKKDDLVSIKSGATWYNGVAISPWVFNHKWYIMQVSGDRAVLDQDEARKQHIMSPINISNLVGGTSTTTSINTLDHYEVSWYYATGDGVWFSGGSSNTTEKNALYSPPDNATKFKVIVKPVAKTYKSGDNDVSYWTGESASKEFVLPVDPPADPSTPTVDIDDNYTLTASLKDISDPRTDKIEFEIYKDNTKIKSIITTVLTQRTSCTYKVAAGGKYRVRCRAIFISGGTNIYSKNWSLFSEEKTTIPTGVGNPRCIAVDKTEVKVTWSAALGAEGYDVEYTKDPKYFDASSSDVSSTSVETTTAYVTGLETGRKWYFRVRAKNTDGESEWSSIISTVIGTKPEPPTTWSLTSTAIKGEKLVLYWVHNSEDSSNMTSARIQLKIGSEVKYVDIQGSTNEDDIDPIYSYTIDTNNYNFSSNPELLWMVRTKGVHDEYSDWSTQRTIKVYAPPTLELNLPAIIENTLTAFPLDISMVAEQSGQTPVSYHVSITPVNSYDLVDITGSPVFVSAGSEIYSKVITTSNPKVSMSLSAGDLLLKNNELYKITAVVSMDSGLTAKDSVTFIVDLEDFLFTPDARISIDKDTLSAHIIPFCRDESDKLVDDIMLSVYRREYNGTLTKIATDVSNYGVYTVIDPHPSLDYARYRIVAQSTVNGGVTYSDLPGQPVGEPSIVIQWDENWSDYDYTEDAVPEINPWNGSMLRLPYNVDITEKYDPDVALIGYIGRKHPVSYFGTQRGESASWSTEIVKSDKDTIYALRRLASWQGNVYVREPSGTGYWARVTVSFPIKHRSLTVPVSFDIVRVEGDI